MTLFDGDRDTWSGTHKYPNETGRANETWNFNATPSGRTYGFVQNARERNLKISRLGAPASADAIEGITVVWCSRRPLDGQLVVHGWYLNAIAYRQPMKRPDGKRVGNMVVRINFEAAASDACLLEPSLRTFPVPSREKNTLGHSDILYVDQVNKPLARKLRRYLETAAPYARPPAPGPGTPPDQHGWGGGESPRHRALKRYVLENPGCLKLGDLGKGQEEYVLPSLDGVDVWFRSRNAQHAVEVKPVACGEDEHRRGIYQCIKYKALLEAESRSKGSLRNCVPVLVTEDALSDAHRREVELFGIVWRQIRLPNSALTFPAN